MANIYALQGDKDKGKTTTLIKLCNLLQEEYGVPVTPIQYLSNKKPIDIKEILTNKEGKKIGITSQGDDATTLKKEINYFLDNNCEIIFCACRPIKDTTGTYDAVNSFANNNKIDFIQQVIQNNTCTMSNATITMQEQCNECMAKRLKEKAGL